MSFTQILGYAAGAITTITFVPQVIKTLKEKSTQGVSLMMFVIAAINEAMWIGYGVLQDDWVIILTNSSMIILSLLMIFLKLKYGKK